MPFSFFFFFNDTATTEIYTLSLHDALPISRLNAFGQEGRGKAEALALADHVAHAIHRQRQFSGRCVVRRSEEHTSELQSHSDLVCRLLLEKKKKSSVTTWRKASKIEEIFVR